MELLTDIRNIKKLEPIIVLLFILFMIDIYNNSFSGMEGYDHNINRYSRYYLMCINISWFLSYLCDVKAREVEYMYIKRHSWIVEKIQCKIIIKLILMISGLLMTTFITGIYQNVEMRNLLISYGVAISLVCYMNVYCLLPQNLNDGDGRYSNMIVLAKLLRIVIIFSFFIYVTLGFMHYSMKDMYLVCGFVRFREMSCGMYPYSFYGGVIIIVTTILFITCFYRKFKSSCCNYNLNFYN